MKSRIDGDRLILNRILSLWEMSTDSSRQVQEMHLPLLVREFGDKGEFRHGSQRERTVVRGDVIACAPRPRGYRGDVSGVDNAADGQIDLPDLLPRVCNIPPPHSLSAIPDHCQATRALSLAYHAESIPRGLGALQQLLKICMNAHSNSAHSRQRCDRCLQLLYRFT